MENMCKRCEQFNFEMLEKAYQELDEAFLKAFQNPPWYFTLWWKIGSYLRKL